MLPSENSRPLGQQLYYKETVTQVFSCNIAKFLRTPILENSYERLLLSFLPWKTKKKKRRKMAAQSSRYYICDYFWRRPVFFRIRFGENFISFVKYKIVVYITDVVGINKLTVKNMNTYSCVYNGVPLKPIIMVFSEQHITKASNSEAYLEPYQTLKRSVLQN